MDTGTVRRGWVRLRHHLPRRATPRFVFHHLPKTGGVSVRRALANWVYRFPDYRYRTDPDDFHSLRVTPEPVDLARLKAWDCLVGHFDEPDIYLHERYPDVLRSRDWFLFTFVRHPLQLQLSLYSWETKKGKDFGIHELQEELLQRPNYLAHRLPCDEDDWESVMRRYHFVGTTGDLQGSMDRLADLLGVPPVAMLHLNRSRKRNDLPAFEDGFMEEFERRNRVDYAIYGYALEEWGDSRWGADPDDRDAPSVEEGVPIAGSAGGARSLRE